ncbi:MAG: SRPBCC domain-containing protein [Phenylobacterium sp.]|nr:MAG: SRPBCC domain-containing protein [Phenylobacterium sp.]
MAEVSVTHRYSASPERVFDAWLDPKVAPRFLFATPAGQMIICEIDGKVGGRFDLTERRPDMGDVKHVGEYLEIDRPRRLVFTFGVPQFDPGMTRVEVEIRPAGRGCELTLTQRDVPDQWAEGSQDGWTKILAGLEPALAGRKAAGWG